ncbi:hypothetical protein LCGC14_0537340 [marine sediment metagenome]|uniref:HNH nuclease domain-containing protein n=1 Tax=marine sediment metagenome TaxID=412755 RepID=A0A0F9RYK2_9ZZZZ
MKKVKRCTNCYRFLGESAFGWQKDKRYLKGGRACSVCKKCCRVKSYIRRELNPEYFKQYYKDNTDHLKQYSKQHRKDNPEYYKQYYKNNPEYFKQHFKRYWKDNAEYKRQYDKQYGLNNRDKVYAKNAKRRAMKLRQSPQLNQEEKHRIETLYRRAQKLSGDWHVDHIRPISKGGLHHPDNMQLIPANENLRKGAKYPEEFYGK